ncbi:alpha-tocopherol transfer protein-like isoform X2 [Frankliniella occidentalis]|uniref:Alpha-tocopherol transfer protein-like isoform X2 n=1 Tax=Frankliniella occidentalis TaxID=133901 RepID=A0A9C6X9D4_FRAOC|nr:alpha-tocopherol transfer protein-like isoform X2 [Frankliniella occidentalis]
MHASLHLRRRRSTVMVTEMKRASVQEELRKNPQLKQEDIDAMREWVETQTQLPDITDLTLVLFIHCCFYDIEIAKKTLLKFYNFQYNVPQICLNRDPSNEEIVQIAKAVGIVILDGRDRNGNVVVFQRLIDTNPACYNMDLTVKLSHMLSTIWQLENGTAQGTVLVYDQRGFGLSHMARGSLSSLKNMIHYVQECAPINVVGIHVIYTNAVIDAILSLFKPFMKSSLYKLIKTYREENLQEFYNIIPQEVLPKEYGGQQVSLEELSVLLQKLVTIS